MDQDEVRELERLEESLWRSETRFDPEHMRQVLHTDFAEFGQSGRIYTIEQVLALPATPIAARLPLPGFSAQELAAGVVLLTYRSEIERGGQVDVANRSSIWLRTPAGWRLRFHQGTPTTW